MDRYNKKSNLKEDKTSTSLNSHDIFLNSVDKFCNFVSGGVFGLNEFAVLFIVGGAVGICRHFIPISKRKMTPNDLATLSCHRQAFAPMRKIEQPIYLDSASLLTSETGVKCPSSTSALKKKDPCSASSSKLKRAQQPSPKRISVTTQTKLSLKIASAQTHTTTNQIIPRVLGDISSLSHIHINRKTKDKWKQKSNKRVYKPDTGFPVGKRITLEKTNKTKRSLAPKCQAFPGGGDFDGGLSFSEKLVKYIDNINEKNLTLGDSNMKMILFDDPCLMRLFKATRKRLTDIKLTHDDQLEAIHFALRETCMYSRINSTSIVTKQDRGVFSQEIDLLILSLTTPFELNDSVVNRVSHSFGSFWNGAGLSYPWDKLKQKYFDLIKSDLALELTDLDRDFGRTEPYFLLAATVRSLAPEYFKKKVSESFKVIQESMDLAEKQSEITNRYSIILSANDKLSNKRSQTLVNEFDQTFPDQEPYEQLFCSATGQKERIVSNRESFDLSSLVVKKNFTGEYRFFDIFGI